MSLIPVITQRLLDPTLQRSNSGSIGLGSALSLFSLLSQGTKTGCGSWHLHRQQCRCHGAGMAQQAADDYLRHASLHPTTLCRIEPPEGSKAQVVQGTSTKMFEFLASKGAKLDMLHLDGRLTKEDLSLLAKLLKPDTLIALDDCEGDEAHEPGSA